MSSAAPHFLLLTETQSNPPDRLGGCWRFVLQRVDGNGRIEVSECEPDVQGERLQLLSVVRGLEALEQPSRVTLVTHSRYVDRGIRSGISVWRDNHWQWERYGELTPVKNRDLWQRVDRAMRFHKVHCRVWKLKRGGDVKSVTPVVSPINKLRPRSPVYSAGQFVRRKVAPITSTILRPIPWVGSSNAYGCT